MSECDVVMSDVKLKNNNHNIHIPRFYFDGEYICTSKKKYYVETILELKRIQSNYKGSFDDLLNYMNKFQYISASTLKTLCFCLENGYFNDFFKTYEKSQENKIKKYLENYCKYYSFRRHILQIDFIEYDRIHTKDEGYIHYTLEHVLYVKNNLLKYANEGYNKNKIIEDVGVNNISNLLYNLYKGTFDKWIQEYLSNDYKYNKHLRRVYGEKNKKTLKFNSLNGNLLISDKNRPVKYTIDEIIEVKKNIPNFKDYPTNLSLTVFFKHKMYNYNNIIWNIEEGNFDKWIQEYESFSEVEKIPNLHQKKSINEKLINAKKYNIRGISKSNFLILADNGNFYVSNFTVDDVVKIKEYKENYEYFTIKSLESIVNLSSYVIKRILKTLITDGFDKYI